MSTIRLLGTILMAIGIAAGAFGAHGLKGQISDYYLTVFEKAVFYQLIHALALLIISGWGRESFAPAILMSTGVVIFSGSLFLLVLTGAKWLGAITPIGGTALIFAWGWLAWQAYRS